MRKARMPWRAPPTCWERASHADDAETEDAAAAFAGLPMAARMALVRSLVRTRRRELTLAYRNVVALLAGYRHRQGALYPEPCLIFAVKRKWRPGREGSSAQRLPEHLLLHGPGRHGKPCLYAVPTDVQTAGGLQRADSRSDRCVLMPSSISAAPLPGTLTCRLQARDAQGRGPELLLSAMHVLTPIPAGPQPVADIAFSAAGGSGAVLGRSQAWGGFIDAQTGRAFDAQLADPAAGSAAHLAAAFAGLRLSSQRPALRSAEEFDALAPRLTVRVLVPDNHPRAGARAPVWAQFSHWVAELPLGYQVRSGNGWNWAEVAHEELLGLRVRNDCPIPEAGDSGSAVVCQLPGQQGFTLVGMYIAGGNQASNRDLCYVLPAWALLDPKNWHALPAGTRSLRPRF